MYLPEKGGSIDTPVYGRDELLPGVELAGPAVIEERESSAVLPPGCGARAADHGSLLVEVSGPG